MIKWRTFHTYLTVNRWWSDQVSERSSILIDHHFDVWADSREVAARNFISKVETLHLFFGVDSTCWLFSLPGSVPREYSKEYKGTSQHRCCCRGNKRNFLVITFLLVCWHGRVIELKRFDSPTRLVSQLLTRHDGGMIYNCLTRPRNLPVSL